MHCPRLIALNEIADQHQYHYTPGTSARDEDVCFAVALDCEMGTAASGDSELIRVTLIDYFSGAVLVNNLVEPDVPMQHLNTRFSGVTWADMNEERKKGRCLKGKAGARKALWRYVKPDTIVVGHGASNDLRALRWIHGSVVDSFVIEFGAKKKKAAEIEKKLEVEAKRLEEAVSKLALVTEGPFSEGIDPRTRPAVDLSGKILSNHGDKPSTVPQKKLKRSSSGSLSLKNLVKKRLSRNIQMGGRSGHDSLEDAIAARDLVHFIITHGLEDLW